MEIKTHNLGSPIASTSVESTLMGYRIQEVKDDVEAKPLKFATGQTAKEVLEDQVDRSRLKTWNWMLEKLNEGCTVVFSNKDGFLNIQVKEPDGTS